MAAVCRLLQFGSRSRRGQQDEAKKGLAIRKGSSSSSIVDQRETVTAVDDDCAQAPLSVFGVSATEVANRDLGVRGRFLTRLSQTGAWEPPERRTPQSKTVTFFDWDDTLFCTSHIHDGGLKLRRGARDPRLLALASSSRALLEAAIAQGPTFIVTNASSGWVEATAKKYLPELLPALARVTVISARSDYEGAFPKRVALWKVKAFESLRGELRAGVATNILSIGDARYEMDAAHALAKVLPQAVVKTVKLCEQPSVEELCAEHRRILGEFRRIAELGHDLHVVCAL